MKKFSIFIATIMMVTAMEAAEKLDLKSITSGEFSASYVTGINPIEGTDLYASISNDGKQIVSYSFKSGKQVAVLFDIPGNHQEQGCVPQIFQGRVFHLQYRQQEAPQTF